MKKTAIVLTILGSFLIGNTAFGMAFDNDLYFGSQGNDVSKLQEFLTNEGVYAGPITGNFYSLTLKAVKDFQVKYGVSPAAGYFGPLTRYKANGLLGADITASNEQAIGELGSAPATTTTKSASDSMQEQINALLSQVSLLQQQLQAQQQTNASIKELQDKVVAQTQTIQSQQEAISQIAENTIAPIQQAVIVPEVVKELSFGRVDVNIKSATFYVYYKENGERVNINSISLSSNNGEIASVNNGCNGGEAANFGGSQRKGATISCPTSVSSFDGKPAGIFSFRPLMPDTSRLVNSDACSATDEQLSGGAWKQSPNNPIVITATANGITATTNLCVFDKR